jgi:hypothetical protein
MMREIYVHYLKEKSIRRVTGIHNGQGRTTKKYITADSKTADGGKFGINYVQHVLKNVLYLGKVKYQGEISLCVFRSNLPLIPVFSFHPFRK